MDTLRKYLPEESIAYASKIYAEEYPNITNFRRRVMAAIIRPNLHCKNADAYALECILLMQLHAAAANQFLRGKMN
jgi:hypothetical protein